MAFAERDQILTDLKAISDVKERFSYLIKKGKEFGDLPEEKKTEDFRIKGCNSQLWLVPEFKDGKIFFEVDSDAAIPKGIAAVLVAAYNGLTPKEALELDPSFLAEGGIEQHLSMNRRSGLSNICKQIKYYAMAFLAMSQK